jgi:hypothetical protein
MSPNWRLEFCGCAVWNLFHVSQLATWILWLRGMELVSCLPTGDLNFMIPPPQGTTSPSGPGSPHYRGFTITLRHTTLGRTPLDEWSARRRDFYPTTHSTHNRQAAMLPAGCERAIPASERPLTYVLDRAATGIDAVVLIVVWIRSNCRPTDEFVVVVVCVCVCVAGPFVILINLY